ncbi:hypothetical protein [Streptomyces sp. NBC_00057]|uniref:hypothetical protein n=1 Tax=Streptomyces sp. NBC_00057 TaxID=2975634 RepID=UPI003245EC2A
MAASMSSAAALADRAATRSPGSVCWAAAQQTDECAGHGPEPVRTVDGRVLLLGHGRFLRPVLPVH